MSALKRMYNINIKFSFFVLPFEPEEDIHSQNYLRGWDGWVGGVKKKNC